MDIQQKRCLNMRVFLSLNSLYMGKMMYDLLHDGFIYRRETMFYVNQKILCDVAPVFYQEWKRWFWRIQNVMIWRHTWQNDWILRMLSEKIRSAMRRLINGYFCYLWFRKKSTIGMGYWGIVLKKTVNKVQKLYFL